MQTIQFPPHHIQLILPSEDMLMMHKSSLKSTVQKKKNPTKKNPPYIKTAQQKHETRFVNFLV